MKTYEELHLDYLNALAMCDHLLRCNGELLEFIMKERSGGYHRYNYQGMENTH